MEAPNARGLPLRVRCLPGALSPAAVTTLLTHYGASHVYPSRRSDGLSSGREPGLGASENTQSATAYFPSPELRQHARQRLHGLELGGHRVEAMIENESSTSIGFQPPLPKSDPPPLPPLPPPAAPISFGPVPLAPHLGLHFAPSPLLEYKYPRATEAIVRNIANALMALPKFYTQVLHLMNKMNLPPPFEEGAIPGRFSAATSRKRPRDPPPIADPQYVEEEEDDVEDNSAPVPRPDDSTLTSLEPNTSSGLLQVNPARQKRSPTDLKPTLHPTMVLHQTNKPKRQRVDTEQLSKVFTTQVDSKREQVRPGVISAGEVRRRRQSTEELREEPMMANYVRGEPSTTLMVRNLADGVDEDDLRSIFAFVLPASLETSCIAIDISSNEREATVVYPALALTEAAVNELHGVVLEGCPLILSFQSHAQSQPNPEATADANLNWTLKDLELNRMDDATLSNERAMKNYQRGDCSAALYVRNLSKTVIAEDLAAVFGATLPPPFASDTLNIRHFTEGRMKCQAFVEFPSEELAQAALEHTHGVVVKGKPLVVCFRKATSGAAPVAKHDQDKPTT